MLLRAHLMSGRIAVGIIAGLVALWAVLALWASSGNSATFDEPLHAAASMAAVRGELGINPEHPPLWKYVAGLPHLGQTDVDTSPIQMAIARTDPVYQWGWTVDQLYRGGTRDGDRDVRRSQYAMALVFGVGLLLTAAAFAWRLAPAGRGPLAAVLVTTLLALDPLLLAHGPIVSNDVAVTVMLLGVVWAGVELRRGTGATWRGGQMGMAMILGLLMAAAACTKYTGVVGVPLGAGLLLARRKPLASFTLVALATALLGVWAIYGFRYAPSPDGGLIDTNVIALRVGQMRALADPANAAAADPNQRDLPTLLLLAIERARYFPQALTAGLLMSYGVTRSNPAFAFGNFSHSGWWWYFPAALAVKVPLGLLAAWAVAIAARVKLGRVGAGSVAACAVALGFITILSPLNIGVRHAMPVVVLGSLLAAVALARWWEMAWVRKVTVIAGVALAIETLAAFPGYLSFFNLAGRVAGPERLLADSNLDWGQDLKRLGEWRRAHPQGRLYLAYWGTSDPRSYGLEGPNLPDTWDFAGTERPVAGPDTMVAVSVTFLQGANRGEVLPFYARLKQARPIARVGETIYIYRLQ